MENSITYTEKDGIFYPDIALPEQPQVALGKYAIMRLTFLKNHRRGMYISHKSSGKLTEHLHETQTQAHDMIEQIVAAMAKSEGTNETLKADIPMRWTGLMSNYRHSAEEVALYDLVYA